jgi:2-hydroxychromene-2-carboxylate isomerase
MTFPVVDAYLGVDSSYSYLASTQLDRIAAEAGASFNWIPVVVADMFPNESSGSDENAAKAQEHARHRQDPRYRQADLAAWAEYYGVRYRDPADRLTYDPRMLARAAIAAGAEFRVAMMMRIFDAIYVDNRTRIDQTDCVSWARQIGLDGDEFRKALSDPIVETERYALGERGRARGAFAAPYFIAGARSFYGNDRLVLLEHHLRVLAGEVRQTARW